LGLVLLGFGFGYGIFLAIVFWCEWRRRQRIEQFNRSLPTELQNSSLPQLETAKEEPKDLP
jgi:hypothetical protein